VGGQQQIRGGRAVRPILNLYVVSAGVNIILLILSYGGSDREWAFSKNKATPNKPIIPTQISELALRNYIP